MNFTRLHEFATNHKVDYECLVILFSMEFKEVNTSMLNATVELNKATKNIDGMTKMLFEQDKRLKVMAEKVHDFNALPWYSRIFKALKRI